MNGLYKLMSCMVALAVLREVSADCPPNYFKSSLNGTHCDNLYAYKEIKTIDDCKQLCCDNVTCTAWEWCPSGCSGWGSSHCHIGNPTSNNCSFSNNWIGGSTFPEPTPKPRATRKRGFSGFIGSQYTCDDPKALGLQDSWFYSWLSRTSQYNKCGDQVLAKEFAPMIIGIGSADQLTGAWLKHFEIANAHYLLGYNEPDPGNHPHMCSPAAAAHDWPKVQNLASLANLELVSPAMSSTGFDDNGVSTWLDEFFGNCTNVPGCDASLIKYIALHDYTGNVTRMMKRMEGAYSYYKRPIWLTEFAIGKWTPSTWGPTRSAQDAFMKEALPALEASPAVFRYAWFSARDAPGNFIGHSCLLPYNSSSLTPTSTGDIYKSL